MNTITVNLGPRSYPIYIGANVLGELGRLLRERQFSDRVVVVTDSVVGKIYCEPTVQALANAGLDPWVVEIPAGEEHKNLAWLAFIYDKLIEGRTDRRSPLVALGGGVVGDMAGFAAATLLRGLPLIQVPTTLLAQVDASVGGKTGINHSTGKNLIGAFYQPRLVLIDVDMLKTLPQREFVAGLAEVIKYGIILDPELFAMLEGRLSAILHLNSTLLTHIVTVCCRLKARVVEEDETEGGYRAILNFGHTLGHAVESATEYREFLHGEAVAMGLIFAARLSQQRGLCTESTYERIRQLIKRAGLPVEVPSRAKSEHLALAMETDKKTAAGKIKFVCIEEIGKTCFEYMSAKEIVGYL